MFHLESRYCLSWL